ncbi:MAG: nucleotidyltransferase family protein [Parafilimonas terrae]|nr:nucleotidyltransferase family protein [Parafilimonas terrae]
MRRDDVIALLRASEAELRRSGVQHLWLFGSVARDEARDGSDVDLFVDPDYERFGFVELIRVEDRLSRDLGSAVDLTTRDGLHPHLRPAIEREAIQVL